MWEELKVTPVKISFTSANKVNYESPASTQHVLSSNSFIGPSYEACSSNKMSDLFKQKWNWRPHAQVLLLHIRHALLSWH